MGAATFVKALDGTDVEKHKRVLKGTLTLSDDYATGGDTLPDIGFRTVDDLLIEAGSDVVAAGYSFVLGGTPDAPTIEAHTAAGEVAAATDLAAVDVAVRILGT